MCEPGARHGEYVYVWELASVPEVIVTPSILKLISSAHICVNSCTGTELLPAGQLVTGGDSDGSGSGGRSDGGLATGGDTAGAGGGAGPM